MRAVRVASRAFVQRWSSSNTSPLLSKLDGTQICKGNEGSLGSCRDCNENRLEPLSPPRISNGTLPSRVQTVITNGISNSRLGNDAVRTFSVADRSPRIHAGCYNFRSGTDDG